MDAMGTLGRVWLPAAREWRPADAETTGEVPDDVWIVGYQLLVRWLPAPRLFAHARAPSLTLLSVCAIVQSQKKKGPKHAAGAVADDFKTIKVFTLTSALHPEQGAWTDLLAPAMARMLLGQVSREHASFFAGLS